MNLDVSAFPPPEPPEKRGRTARRLGIILPLIPVVPLTIAIVTKKLHEHRDADPGLDQDDAYATYLDHPGDAPPWTTRVVSGLDSEDSLPIAEAGEPGEPGEFDEVADADEPGSQEEAEGLQDPLEPMYVEVEGSSAEAEPSPAEIEPEPADDASTPGIVEVAPQDEEPEAVQAPDPLRHRVEPGDSFYGIATDHGIAPETLAKANGLELANPLPVGRVLLIPTAGKPVDVPRRDRIRLTPITGKPPGAPATEKASPGPGPKLRPSSGELGPPRPSATKNDPLPTVPRSPSFLPERIIYIVQSHDTVDSIAVAHSTTPQALRDWNNGIRDVVAGQTLIVPIDGCRID